MSFFIVLGLFSIAAGILLIFLIFMMLAAERRSEMGMARAVGMKRRHLIQGFIAEGTAYDLGAALIGAALGVGVAFAIAGVMSQLIGEFLSITPHATWRSLTVAYALGVTVTFMTILFASVRSSRLNIVQAIRDLPEFRVRQRLRPQRTGWNPFHVIRHVNRLFRYYIGWSPVVAVLGVLLMLSQPHSAFWFSLGLSITVLGIALFVKRFLPERLVYTVAAGLMLLYWLLPFSVTDKILPDFDAGGIEMFFLSGIFMVTYATLIIMWNAEVVVGGVGLLGRAASRWMPAVKTAVAYPLASKGRTGMTIAMFSLVIFSLVTLTTINKNFSALFSSDEADAGWDISVVTSPANPVGDLTADLRAANTDPQVIDNIAAVGRLDGIAYFNAQLRSPLDEDKEWKRYGVNGMDEAYMQNAEVPLQARADGYADDQAVWDALKSDPNVAVIDSFAFDSGDDFGNDPDAFKLPREIQQTDGHIPTIQIELQNSRTGESRTVTVIGVIDSKVSTMFGLYIPEQGFISLYGQPDFQNLVVKLDNNSDAMAERTAKDIESALLIKGVQAESIKAIIDENLAIQNGFLNLLQGFMGLGLFVGIAALGVISFRSVVERRQQIGMLRAIGYQRNMVATSFLLESLVIAALGVLSGTIMAIILSYNLINSDDFEEGADFSGFVVPWPTIMLFVVASLVAAALMTWIPARKASSVPIAEALRYE
jgi:putative ABC transport system permease protein